MVGPALVFVIMQYKVDADAETTQWCLPSVARAAEERKMGVQEPPNASVRTHRAGTIICQQHTIFGETKIGQS